MYFVQKIQTRWAKMHVLQKRTADVKIIWTDASRKRAYSEAVF